MAVWPRGLSADLVLNELDVDQIGTDGREFVEVYNRGPGSVNLATSPHVLVFFNGDDDTPPVLNGSYQVVPLSGVLPVGGRLLVGGSAVPGVQILIGGGGSNLIQNGTDAVALYAGTAANWSGQHPPTTVGLVDALVYGTDDEPDAALQSALGGATLYDEWDGLGPPGVVYSIARFPDGGMIQTGATPTPGTANDAAPPVSANRGTTLVHRNDAAATEVLLTGNLGGFPADVGELRFRVRTLPGQGTLLANGAVVTGSGATALPYLYQGVLTYRPAGGYAGLDGFEFDALDSMNRISPPSMQDLAVQAGGVVISEIMHTPGTPQFPQDQRIFEFLEIFNYSHVPLALTRLDCSTNTSIDTTNNLRVGGVPTSIPARTMRLLASGGLTDDSDEMFRCEWGLSEQDIIRVPHDRFELLFAGSRVLLFGEGDVLLDAINFDPPAVWTFLPGASQSVREGLLSIFNAQLDARGNDHVPLWPYSGPDNILGLRLSYSGVGQGSPGFVPTDYNEDFVPLPLCVPLPLGGCCLPTGSCAALTADGCGERDGFYHGDYVPCVQVSSCLQPPSGACCLPTGDCLISNAPLCGEAAGVFRGAGSSCAGQNCPASLGVVLNELEYDQAGVDTAEYVELFGPSGTPLFGYKLFLYNGADQAATPYREIPLLGVLSSTGFFVIGSAAVPNVGQAAWTVDGLQNGPDGIALTRPALVPPFNDLVIDRIAYGGSFVATDGPAAGLFFPDIAAVDQAPPDDHPAGEISLQQIPNGVGSWRMTSDDGLGPDGTPGSTNVTPLPAAYGACCLPTGSCLDALESPACAAAGGDYRGDATNCSAPCPVLVGACCLPNGQCQHVTLSMCTSVGGTFHGSETLCVTAPPCPVPPTGACCLVGGMCVTEDAYDCSQIAGDYRGHGTTCTAQGASCGGPVPLKINEIHRDDASTDDREFLEIYGPGGLNLSTYALVEIEGDYSPTGQRGRVDAVWSLAGWAIPGDGYLVVGDEGVAHVDLVIGQTNQIENGTATYLLVAGYDLLNYPAGTDIDVDDNRVADAGVNLGSIVDGFGIADSGINAPPAEADVVYFGVVTVGPVASAAPAGVARQPDGIDTESPADFCRLGEAGDGSDGLAVPSSGTTNLCSRCPLLGDADGDADLDLRDFGRLQACHTGSIGPLDPPAYPSSCLCLDFDADGDIDLLDFREFQHAATQ